MAAAERSGDKDGAATRRAVKRLSFGSSWQERTESAAVVGRLARSDEQTKRALPELGLVPPLLSMLAEGGEVAGAARVAAVRALLELAREHTGIMYPWLFLLDPLGLIHKFVQFEHNPRAVDLQARPASSSSSAPLVGRETREHTPRRQWAEKRRTKEDVLSVEVSADEGLKVAKKIANKDPRRWRMSAAREARERREKSRRGRRTT